VGFGCIQARAHGATQFVEVIGSSRISILNLKLFLGPYLGTKTLVQRKTLERDHPMLFVLSTGRSGSAMLARLLGVSSSICAVHELQPHLFRLRRVIYESQAWEDPQIIRWVLFGDRLAKYRDAQKRGQIIVDSSPFLSFFPLVLQREFPLARFLFVHRDPREFVRSGMRRGWYDRHPNDLFRLVPSRNAEEAAAWTSWSRFEKICWLWKEYNEVILELVSRLPESHVVVSASASIWSDPVAVTSSVAKMMEAEVPADEMLWGTVTDPLNAQVNGDFPTAEHWTNTQHATLEQIAGATMAKLGYL